MLIIITLDKMNVQEMHVGIDLAQRMVNSNQFQKLEKEEKDFIINKAIGSLVIDSIPTEENQVNVVDDDTIKKQYEILEPLLIETEYVDFVKGDKYIEIALPKQPEVLIQTGQLYKGYTYKIVTPGTTDLSMFGCPTNNVGFEFTYKPINIVFAFDGGNYVLPMITGYTYRIKRIGSVNFTTRGASANEVGVIFTSTGNAITQVGNSDAELEILAGLPAWTGGTSLIISKRIDVYALLRTSSLIYTDCTFSAGSLRKGYYYKVTAAGTISDLVSFGSEHTILEVGYIFLCTKTGTPAWTSGVKLTELVFSPNRLPAVKDIDNAITHPIGTLASSPISTRIGGRLRVYHDNKFDIHKVVVTYVRPPVRVDSIKGINCDLNESIHDTIVDKAASYIAATQGSPNYQLLKTEETLRK